MIPFDHISASILDTDLYKFTMQQAVFQHFPTAIVTYRFTNRTADQKFTKSAVDEIKSRIIELESLTLSSEERTWLQEKCPYFTVEYLNFLENFRFNPSKLVKIEFVPQVKGHTDEEWGDIEIDITGLWSEVMLYDVPIMYIISQVYYYLLDTKWDYVGQFDLARQKGLRLFRNGVSISEFGTRRRRSLKTQKIIIDGLLAAGDEIQKSGVQEHGTLLGTSNVHFARILGLNPIGTVAHEWIMGIAAKYGYKDSNNRAMDLWEKTYPDGQLTIALTDTFTTDVFFKDFLSNPERAKRWRGLRHDSGDPFDFFPKAKVAFETLGIDLKSKMLVFSDSLDIDKSIKLQERCSELGMKCSMGIGTHLTNDFKTVKNPEKNHSGEGNIRTTGEQSIALNIVVKIRDIDGELCVKLSDDVGKYSGESQIIQKVIKEVGAPVAL